MVLEGRNGLNNQAQLEMCSQVQKEPWGTRDPQGAQGLGCAGVWAGGRESH